MPLRADVSAVYELGMRARPIRGRHHPRRMSRERARAGRREWEQHVALLATVTAVAWWRGKRPSAQVRCICAPFWPPLLFARCSSATRTRTPLRLAVIITSIITKDGKSNVV